MEFDLPLSEAGKTMTGFDLIAIKRLFGAAFTELDREIAPYAIHLILAKRQNAAASYDDTMGLSLGDIEAAFKPEPDATFRDDG